MGDFSDFLKEFHQGTEIEPVRLNKQMKSVIRKLIEEDMEKTCDMEEDSFNRFMEAMMWLKQQIGDTEIKTRLTKTIGLTIHFWISDNERGPLSGEPEYDKALQWIYNKIAKKYSVASMLSEVQNKSS